MGALTDSVQVELLKEPKIIPSGRTFSEVTLQGITEKENRMFACPLTQERSCYDDAPRENKLIVQILHLLQSTVQDTDEQFAVKLNTLFVCHKTGKKLAELVIDMRIIVPMPPRETLFQLGTAYPKISNFIEIISWKKCLKL